MDAPTRGRLRIDAQCDPVVGHPPTYPKPLEIELERDMTETEPTREQVAAMEEALGCRRVKSETSWAGPRRDCRYHVGEWTDLGCPSAVAAARHEAATVAEVEADRDSWMQQSEDVTAQAVAILAERDALRAVVGQVRALHKVNPLSQPHAGCNGDCRSYYSHAAECDDCGQDWPCATVALLPEPVSSSTTWATGHTRH